MVIVKKSIQSIIKPLTNICNKSIEKWIFPDDVKITKIVPLFKGEGDKKQFSNYRPVSILPQFSKILGKYFIIC